MSTDAKQTILDKVGPKDRGFITKAREVLLKEEQQKDDMSSEQT